MSKDDAAIPAAAAPQRILSKSNTISTSTSTGVHHLLLEESSSYGISQVSCDDNGHHDRAATAKTAEDQKAPQHDASCAPTPTTISALPQHRSFSSHRHHDDEEATTPKPSAQLLASPIGTVDGCVHSESVASDLSFSSAERSPTRNVPPAPPSTPASTHTSVTMMCGLTFDAAANHPSSSSMLDAIGPPTLESTEYAATTRTLEQEQRFFSDTAATPLPPRSDTAATPREMATAPKLPTDDFSDWAVGDRYELVRILGRGSYGEVAQAMDTAQDDEDETTYVAIKRIQSPFDQQVDAVRLYREIHILRQMQQGRPHECLIQLLDVVQPPTDDLDDFHDLYLVFEYADTDLHKLILSPQYLTTAHIQTFLYQMLAGLKYIHSCSVIHRDLKPANILLNEDCSLKICDFGLARIVDREAISTSACGARRKVVEPTTPHKRKRPRTEKGLPDPPVPVCAFVDNTTTAHSCATQKSLTRQLTKHVVTRWYRAPELILIQPYTSAVDIWSLGCIFAELLGMQEGNVPGYADRKPLFPGGTCYPLSGEGGNIKPDDRLDQLSVIFSVIGTPSKEDIKATGNANDYIESLPKMKPKSLAGVYPDADKNAINLLEQMLRFNPNDRVTAEDALEHEFFRGVRKKEELERSAASVLTAPAFLDADEIDLPSLKQKIYNEVLWYRDSGNTGSSVCASACEESEGAADQG